MLRKWLLFILVGVLVQPINAQDLNDFKTLKSSGMVPDDFVKLSQDKVKADYASNENDELDKDFFLSSRFFIDELLLSGKMLFNEELSNYVNKVAKYTLRTEKELLKELRFYVLKSSIVNAFSTDQGIVVITTGLLAQLENEAQLAYIIAHEVSHYTEKHVRDHYIERQSSTNGVGKYRQLDYESRVNELSVYSKNVELEADKFGIELFLKSEYDVNEIFTSFEMLLYSYLPFDEVKFDPSFLNTDKMEIPITLFPDTIRPVTLEDDYDDESSTHPNIKKRLDAALAIIGSRKSKGELQFKISESEFNRVQALARFEGVNLALAQREYGNALYMIYLLKRLYPENRFLDLSMVKALYGLAKYKNANRYREVVEKPKNIEGESFNLHLFLFDLSREQINVIALRHAYDMHLKYPKDVTFENYFEDLKKEIALKSRVSFKDFKNLPYDEYKANIEIIVQDFDIQDSIAKVDASDLSKYEKIRLKKKLRDLEAGIDAPEEVDESFYNYALYDLVEEGLIQELQKIIEKSQEVVEQTSGKAANRVSKVVVVDPIYRDFNLKNKQNLEKSENKKIKLSNSYFQEYRNLNLEVEMIDSKNLTAQSVQTYNDLGSVFQWIIEVLSHDEIEMIASTHDLMDDVSNRHGTDQFLFTGIYAFKERNDPNFNHLLWAMTIYGLPFVVADLLIIHNYFDLVSFSINSTNDKIVFTQISEINLKATNKIIDVYIYDVLNQVSHGN